MKNGKLVTTYLDYHAETIRLMRDGTVEGAEEACERVASGRESDLWQACLGDGWTVAEIDAAFERRFNVRVRR